MKKHGAFKKEKLKIIDSWKDTAETLSDHKLLKDIKEGLKDIKAGRISRVRNKVKGVWGILVKKGWARI